MTTKIQKEFMFQAGVYIDDTFVMNAYQMSLDMYVEADSITEQNIAMERIHYFLYEGIENSIFVEENETNLIDQYSKCGFKVCTLPAEPHDQVVGIMMMLKLNAILEDRLIVTTVGITSKLSDGVRILHDIEDAVGPYQKDGWWNETNLVINSLHSVKRKKYEGKVVKLFPTSIVDWSDVGLSWKPKQSNSESNETTEAKIHVLSDREK